MKKIIIILLGLVGAAFGQSTIPCITGPFTVTTNLSLPMPFYNQCFYGTQGYNVGMSRIDALFPGGILAVAKGGTGTATPGLIAGTNITITGTYPNQTINSTGGGGAVSSVFGQTGAVPNLSGDVTTSGSSATTMATVNSNVGSFTNANLTVDAKGRITAAANGSTAGNLTGPITSSGTATTVAPTGVIAQKPDTATAIQYAAPTCAGGVACSDSNDGLSWGTAKLNVMTAAETLSGGSTGTPKICGIGIVYIGNFTQASAVSSDTGIWILGAGDPGYASPPSGFCRNSGAITFKGSPKINSGANPHDGGRALVLGGSSTDRNKPAVWLTGESQPIKFEDLAFQFPARGVLIGEDTAHSRSGSGVVAGVTFENVAASLNQIAGNGPAWDITGSSFWIWMNHIGAGGTDAVNDPTGDLAPAILLDGRTNTGVGLINITNSNTNGGSVKFYDGVNGGGLYINNLTSEALYSPATVWIAQFTKPTSDLVEAGYVVTADPIVNGIAAANVTSGHGGSGYSNGDTGTIPSCTGGGATYTVTGVSGGAVTSFTFARGSICTVANGVSTSVSTGGGNGAFQIDITSITGNPIDVLSSATYNSDHYSNSILVSNTTKTSGPMTSLMEAGSFQNTVSPLAQGKVGFFSGRLVGQHDSARRTFGPVAVRYTNLATMPPTLSSGSGTITTGLPAPDGTNNAASIASSSGIYSTKFYRATITPVVGDWLVSGVWARATTANGFFSGPNPDQVASLGLTGTNTLTGITACTSPWFGNQEWMWVWCAAKVTATSGNGDIVFSAAVSQSPDTTTAFYGPVLFRIPSGTISDNEVWELTQNLQSYDAACVVGTVCGILGQKLTEQSFGVMGSTSGVATIVAPAAAGTPTHTLQTTSGTISDTICSGTIALGTSSIGSGAAATTVTQACSGLLTTDNITLDFNASPLAVTGYTPSASGMLTIIKWPTSGQINVSVVNNTGGSITPGAITLNYHVTR